MESPFKITPKIDNLVAEISRILGKLEAITLIIPSPKLRKKNRIKTVKSTLAIEGHTFTEEQITAVLEGKRVLGTEKELLEIQNAIELYDRIDEFKPYSLRDFLKAHKILMKELLASAGAFRSKNVGVIEGTKVKHLAPKPFLVPELISKTFSWAKKENELHPLILSSIVHYELEFIHPFEDGNGRMGRFWQALILTNYDPFFKYVPVESLIEKDQSGYYKALEESDKTGEPTLFIEFLLKVIKESLEETSKDLIGITNTFRERIQKAKSHFGSNTFKRKDYMELFRDLSTASASRDLKKGVEERILKRSGVGNKTSYNFLCI